MSATDIWTYLHDNTGWALGLAGAMFALTAFASLINPARKKELAHWLMGTQPETSWTKGFTALFDGVFGKHHLSLKCFLRSAIASLIAVTLIWLLMGNAETIGIRVETQMTLGAIVLIGLAINVVAEYVSLLETRILLGRMPKNGWHQAGVLIFDLIISAAIIWLAIFLYLRSPLHEGEVESFAEILGVFSVFSVFFYSTFLTSVWTWVYIGSVWLMRFIAWARIAHWLDAENQPVKVLLLVLSLATGVIAFAGALVVSGPLARDDQGTSIADRALCTMFKGRVCLDVAKLTPTEQAQLEFITLACEGGVTQECLDRGLAVWEIDGNLAARLWRSACAGGSAMGCTGLGYLHESGIGMDPGPQEAALLYKMACDGGNAQGCNNLGALHESGIGMDPDPQEAARLYTLGCDGGEARGCYNLGLMHEFGQGIDVDLSKALQVFRRACALGYQDGCQRAETLEAAE
ncbi:MAG: tetratricopeptide repeat protein [Pseudomonadota bacterium]